MRAFKSHLSHLTISSTKYHESIDSSAKRSAPVQDARVLRIFASSNNGPTRLSSESHRKAI